MDATQVVNDSLFVSDEEENEEKPNKGRQPLAKLCVLKNDHVPEREFPLFMGDNVLGRDIDTCTLPLLAPSVSKQHATICISVHQKRGSRNGVDIEAVVRDLGSMNGTRIGRVKLIPNISYPLSEGNHLFMADMPCQYLSLSDPREDEGGQTSGVCVSLPGDSVEKRDGLKLSASQVSQTSAKVSPLGNAEKNNSCLSFETTPVHLKEILVPESESDSDGEGKEGRHKFRGSDSSPTCSTYLTPTNKMVPESPNCIDGTPMTPSSSTRQKPHGHVGKEAPDVDVGERQKKETLEFVDDSDEEEAAGVVENGQTTGKECKKEQLRSKAGFTEEELPQLSTSAISPHAIPKLNMDSDTDVEEDGGETEPAPDPRPDPLCFHMDSDTDVEEDVTGGASAPPGQPEGGDSHPDMSPHDTEKADAAPAPLPDDFQLDSDTDVDEEADDTTSDTAAPSRPDVIGDILGSDDEQALADSAAGSSSSNVVRDPPHLSPVATAPSSAAPGIAAAAAQSENDADTDEDTDVDESSAPPVDRDSDMDADEEKNPRTLPGRKSSGLQSSHLQSCSTPVKMAGEVEEMETQAFVTPCVDHFQRGINSAVRSGALPSCLDGQEEEEEDDFAVAETQSFILQPQRQIQSCNNGCSQASGCESSGEDVEELPSGGASLHLGLSDSSHRQSAAQALAMESTQAFVADNQTNAASADTASLGNDLSIEPTQAYDYEAPARSPVLEGSRKVNVALQETQAYITESYSASEEELQEDTLDLHTSSSLALAETQLMTAFQEEERSTTSSPAAPWKANQIAQKAHLSEEHGEVAQTHFVAPTIADSQRRRTREAEDSVAASRETKSAKQLQLEEANQPLTSTNVMEKQPIAANHIEGDDPIQLLPERKAQLDEGIQPVMRLPMCLAATQPLAISEHEESDDEDSIPVLSEGNVQLKKEMQPSLRSYRLTANRRSLSLAATQPLAISEHEESDEDLIQVLDQGKVQFGREMQPNVSSALPASVTASQTRSLSQNKKTDSRNSNDISHESKVQPNKEKQPDTSSCRLAVATQPMATIELEESDDKDLIPVLLERKVQLDKERQPHTSYSLADNHQSMSIAATQPLTTIENEETDVEKVEVLCVDKKQMNKETQPGTSSLAVPTQPLSIAATQLMATNENEESDEEDSIPVLRNKRKARPLQISEETQSLSSTLEIPSDSWNDSEPSKESKFQGSLNGPPSVTPTEQEEEETQPNLDTLPNSDKDDSSPAKGEVTQMFVNSDDSSSDTDSEILIPGSRKRKSKPLQIEDETQSLVSSQGDKGTREITNSSTSAVECQPTSTNEPGPQAQHSQSEVGTSISTSTAVENARGTRSQFREKEEPMEKRQTRSKVPKERMKKSRPAGIALEEEATSQQTNLLEVQHPERPQGKNAHRERKYQEETEQSEVAEDQGHERLETKAKEQKRDEAGQAPQQKKEEKPETTPRGRRPTRRTIAALPSATPDRDDVPAKRSRNRSTSVSSEVSTSSILGTRGRGAKTPNGSAQPSTSRQAPEQDGHGTRSRSSSSNSLASERSCSSLGSQRGRGGRGRGSGCKMEPGPTVIPPIFSQTPAPKPSTRAQRGKKADVTPTQLSDENDKEKPKSKQAAATRGRKRANVKEPSNAEQSNEGNNSAGEDPLPKRNFRGRVQRTVNIFEALVTPPGSDEVKAKDKQERKKRVLEAEEQDESPIPVQAKRRAKVSHGAQGGRDAKESPPVTASVTTTTSVADSAEGAQPQTAISSKRQTRDASAKSSPVTSRRSSTSLSLNRRPRDASHSYKVLFTGVMDEAGERVLTRLGGSLANGTADMNCLVTDKVRRTVKFMCAVAKGIPVVNIHWLDESGQAGSLLPPDAFIVSDPEQESKFNFRLQESLNLASSQPLLKGYKIHITKSVKPEPLQMREIISCSGATFLPKMPSSHKPHTLVISCTEDWPLCRAAVSAALPIVSAEFVLSGILQHKLDLDAHKLSGPPHQPQPDSGKRRSRRIV
ncbi:mediator of DNA damage checkpoint protein 1 [Vanacampus margaritifer]